METKKEIKIEVPEGYEIDQEKSTFEKIVFKEKVRWRDDKGAKVTVYFINDCSLIYNYGEGENVRRNYNIFATEKQAKSALAMARISQIMENDKRFGGVITDEEWNNSDLKKYDIERIKNRICFDVAWDNYRFLSFHTKEQRDLFLKENEDLIKDYLMLD